MRTILALLLLLATSAHAQDIFRVKKSINPKNVLHYKAQTENCRFKKNAVSAYWIMGEEDNQIEDLTATERPVYLPKLSYVKEKEADFSIGAMDRMGNRLVARTIRVALENCQPRAYLEIEGQEILLKEIDVKLSGIMSVKSMTIAGKRPDGSDYAHTIQK